MKKILLGLTVLFTITCNNTEKTNSNIDVVNIDTLESQKKILGIKPILKDAILKYIDRIDSIAEANTNFSERNLFIAEFVQDKRNCLLIIFHSYCYQKKDFIGYVILKDKMVALYDTPENCNNNLINKDLLNQEVKEGFLNCDEVDAYPYDPECVVYKVLDNDSIEFIEYTTI